MNDGQWQQWQEFQRDAAPEHRELRRSNRTARKEHKCANCGCAIMPGQVYIDIAYIEDMDFYTHKEHENCPEEGAFFLGYIPF